MLILGSKSISKSDKQYYKINFMIFIKLNPNNITKLSHNITNNYFYYTNMSIIIKMYIHYYIKFNNIHSDLQIPLAIIFTYL